MDTTTLSETSVLGRLRQTRGVSVFATLAAVSLLLAAASIVGTAERVAAPNLGFSHSSLTTARRGG